MRDPGQAPIVVRSELVTFCSMLFPADAEGCIELRPIPSRRQSFIPLGDYAAVQRAIETAIADRDHAFVGIATRDGHGGSLEHCVELWALFTDIDFKTTPEADAREGLARFPIKPNLVVHSGGGLHCYWRLKEPLQVQRQAPIIARYLKQLAAQFGGDTASTEPVKLLRLPGSMNFKPEYGTPRPVVLERWHDTPVNLMDLDEWLPAAAPAVTGNGFKSAYQLPDKIPDHHRREHFSQLIGSLRFRNLSLDATLAAAQAENLTRCVTPAPPAHIEQMVRDFFSKPHRPGFTPRPLVLAARTTTPTPVPAGSVADKPGGDDELDLAFLSDAVDVVREGRQIATEGIRYVVEGIVPAYGMLGMLVAYSKVGKTTLGQALGAAVAMGRPFLDRRTTQTRVLYLAAEDPPEYTAYVARVLDVSPGRMTFWRAPFVLDAAGLRQVAGTLRAGGYGLVLMASWQALVCGLRDEENNNAQSADLVQSVRIVAQHTGVPWLIDAHSGKGEDQADDADPNKAMRGASSQSGSADYALWLRYNNGAFGTQRKLSGKGRFVSLEPITLDMDPATGVYTLLGDTKRTATETTWRLILETGALNEGPRSANQIAAAIGLITKNGKPSGTQQKHVRDALRHRPEVLRSESIVRGQKTVLFQLAVMP